MTMGRGGARLGAGGPRKSTAQHELAGTVRPGRMNPREPVYSAAAPEKPAYIAANPIASAEWDRILPLLLAQRVITPAFRAALEAYTTSYADVVDGELLKSAPGFAPYVIETSTDPSGRDRERLRLHPVIKLVNDGRRELRQWAGVLGLLPTTVAKVASSPMPEAQDDDDALLARFRMVPGGKQ